MQKQRDVPGVRPFVSGMQTLIPDAPLTRCGLSVGRRHRLLQFTTVNIHFYPINLAITAENSLAC